VCSRARSPLRGGLAPTLSYDGRGDWSHRRGRGEWPPPRGEGVSRFPLGEGLARPARDGGFHGGLTGRRRCTRMRYGHKTITLGGELARPRKPRRVACRPGVTYFKPQGIPLRFLEEVQLSVDELEALRLKDLEGMEQEEAAGEMNISRQTFQRILEDAGGEPGAGEGVADRGRRLRGGAATLPLPPVRAWVGGGSIPWIPAGLPELRGGGWDARPGTGAAPGPCKRPPRER
jgi:predicted DNA-binding protein (UPF0251 family)